MSNETVDIRGIALSAIKRCRQAGESQEMLARWISEDVNRALATQSQPAATVQEVGRGMELAARHLEQRGSRLGNWTADCQRQMERLAAEIRSLPHKEEATPATTEREGLS